MAKQDDFVKTALRIPRALHAQIQEAADASGRSMNAEMIDRLQAQPGDLALAAMLDRMRSSEDELLDATRKQRDLLWNIADRAEEVLNNADVMMARALPTDRDTLQIHKSIIALRDLISTLKAYR